MKLPPPEAEADGPNLTPIIDVVFLLLIFFLVAARLHEEEREIDTRLPAVVQSASLASGGRQIIVNVNQEGEYVITGKEYKIDQIDALLGEEAKKNPDQTTVLIRADQRVAFRFVAAMMGVCEEHKIKHSCAVLDEEAA